MPALLALALALTDPWADLPPAAVSYATYLQVARAGVCKGQKRQDWWDRGGVLGETHRTCNTAFNQHLAQLAAEQQALMDDEWLWWCAWLARATHIPWGKRWHFREECRRLVGESLWRSRQWWPMSP